jgi:lysophospholipid acyltransferase (LPLAT)-like uncharacterized protein
MVVLLARTWRLEIVGDRRVTDLRDAGHPLLFAVWHGQLLPPLWHRRRENIMLLVSGHRDGERLGDAARRWGYRIVHGSTTRGGASGLRRLVRSLRKGEEVAVTPDGPRGPARVAKPGAVAAARHSGATIVPIGVRASSSWQVRSWDRFVIPRPFARVRLVYGQPVGVPRGTPLESAQRQLEIALEQAEDDARC